MKKGVKIAILAFTIPVWLFSTQPAVAGKPSLLSPFQNKTFDFFPVPIFTTRPDEKESYGLMPVALLSDKNTKAIQTMIAPIGLYNTVIKFSGAGILNHFPHPNNNPDEVLQLYFQWAQKFYREANIRYFNPHFGKKWYVDGNFIWLNTPFRRFFGYGSRTLKTDESNYVSHGFYVMALAGYYVAPHFRINLTESFISTNLKGQAIFDVSDTLTRYGGLSGVQNSSHFIHKASLTYDTRPKGPNSREGFFAEGGYFASLAPLGSDANFHGFSTEAIHMHSLFDDRTTLVFRLFVQDIYGGDLPFYLQSSLGGDRELRSFIPGRFIDNGKLIFTWEQRIKVLKKNVFGIPAELWMDPFLEAGTVFDNFKNLGGSKMKTVGGLGIRMIVPPTVVGRIDIAYGAEGYSVYTQLGYPF